MLMCVDALMNSLKWCEKNMVVMLGLVNVHLGNVCRSGLEYSLGAISLPRLPSAHTHTHTPPDGIYFTVLHCGKRVTVIRDSKPREHPTDLLLCR